MNDEFKPSKNLCMAAAMVLPLSDQQQEWIRMGGDAGNVFKASLGLNADNKLLYGSSVEDAIAFLKYVCKENKKRGVKLNYEFRRVAGRCGERRRWNASSLEKTVMARKGIYVIFGKAKRTNSIHKALLKRIRSADCVGDELEIFSKVAKGMSRKDHAVSIRSDCDGLRLFDNACVKGSVEFNMTNLANKMIDLTHCYYFDLYVKGRKTKVIK
jgi:hypothetical protein